MAARQVGGWQPLVFRHVLTAFVLDQGAIDDRPSVRK